MLRGRHNATSDRRRATWGRGCERLVGERASSAYQRRGTFTMVMTASTKNAAIMSSSMRLLLLVAGDNSNRRLGPATTGVDSSPKFIPPSQHARSSCEEKDQLGHGKSPLLPIRGRDVIIVPKLPIVSERRVQGRKALAGPTLRRCWMGMPGALGNLRGRVAETCWDCVFRPAQSQVVGLSTAR